MQAVRLRFPFGIAASAIVALGFLLRVYRLADQNIWWDEGWTVWMARHDWVWIALRTARDEHPPLHYWLMNLWQNALGPGGFAATAFSDRFVSVVFGVLMIAALVRVSKTIGGRAVGLLAGLFLALARFQVWWSQDIKNYTLSAFFAWLSVWFTWELLFGRPEARRRSRLAALVWFGYVSSATLALYSHYLAALIVLADNVFVGIVLLARWRGGANPLPLLVRWALAQIAALALFAPWLYLYWQNGATWSAAPPLDFALFLRLAATVLSLGVTTYIENYTAAVLGLLLVALLSVGWLLRPVVMRRAANGSTTACTGGNDSSADTRRGWGALYGLVILLIPPVLIYMLSLTPAAIFAPKIQARYLVMLTPAFALLLALGIRFAASVLEAWMARRGQERMLPAAARVPEIGLAVGAALAVLVLGTQLFTLNDYFGERVLRDDYASLAQMINNFGRAGDTVLLNTDQEYPTFLYYLNRALPWVGTPNGAIVDAAAAARVAAQTLPTRAVWVVTIPDALQNDPQRLVEQKIAERLPKQFEQTFGDKRLTLYADAVRNLRDVPTATFSPQMPRAEVFDERLQLVGVDLPVREVLPGDVVRVVTYWQAQAPVTVSLSLQTADGKAAASATVPVVAGARERAAGDLQAPPDLTTGELRIVAQAGQTARQIGTLNVLPRRDAASDAGSGAPLEARSERFGSAIRLTGVRLARLPVRPGAPVQLTLYWQADAPLTTSYTVFVHLLGAQYNSAQSNYLWGQIDRLPLDGKLPTTAWTPNQSVADPYTVTADPNAPPGAYNIEIGLYDAATGARLPVTDANGNKNGDALIVGQVEISR